MNRLLISICCGWAAMANPAYCQSPAPVRYGFGSIYNFLNSYNQPAAFCEVNGTDGNSTVEFGAPGGLTLISGLVVLCTLGKNNFYNYNGVAALKPGGIAIHFDEFNDEPPTAATPIVYFRDYQETVGPGGYVLLTFKIRVVGAEIPFRAIYHPQ